MDGTITIQKYIDTGIWKYHRNQNADTAGRVMSEFLLGLLFGFVSGSLIVIINSGNAISFYGKYCDVDKDIDKFKQVIELQDKKP